MKKNAFIFSMVGIIFGFSLLSFAAETNKIVAIVNSDVITEEELDTFVKLASMDSDSDFAGKPPQEIKKALLERMIEDRLILQEAIKLQVKTDEKQIEDRVRNIKERAGGETAFLDALKNEGVSLTELKEKLKNQLLIYTVIQKEVKNKVNVSPQEVTDYFNEHINQFVTPETAVVDSIFVTTKEDLEKAETQLAQGVDFAEVSKAFSKKSNLGNVGRGQLKKELEDFIFSLKVGQCSRPLEVEGGYYIFLVKDKLEAAQKAIDEVKDKIMADLEEQKVRQRLKEWIEELKDRAYISVRE